MRERFVSEDKRLLPVEIINKEDVEASIEEWKERASGEFFDGEEGLLFKFIYKLVLPSANVDGRVDEQVWKKEGTPLNEYYLRYIKGKIPKSRRAIFTKRAKAIYGPLIEGAVRDRMRSAAEQARVLLKEQAVGDIPDKLSARDPQFDERTHWKGLS